MGEQFRLALPDTSAEAYHSLDVTHLEQIVFDAILSFGEEGCISDEILKHLPTYRYSSITARYKALVDHGLVEVIGTRKGASGRSQRVYRAV